MPATARRRLLGRALALGLVPFAIVSCATPEAAPGGLVVVINEALRLPSISAFEIGKLFLGRSRTFADGSRAALASYGPESSFFNERALGRSDAEVAAVWSRLQFSGRTPPPRVFDTPAEVVDFVRRTPNAIAYLPADAPRPDVRVIFNVPR